ncbi:isocitrate lyase/phosphoenolpyruvate mutase family protein [Neobacillus cucumis]|uniref:isocitrate lyase/PEP mutase family protein n=1 Tax=Neobacillus cucumis TaxID=1740721 RepID=UPI0018DF293C|nr:isocitrate lyase/phosphoenolpyruvate mutase family protein [Neobacillus cucumis]MBI0579531.1 isocitrate lyase/phosphoenolpyruvate mutase family protein [Neobacillus cucumis]
MNSIRKKFKERVSQTGIIIAPGAYDSLTSVLIEQAGFEALYMTGGGISYTTLGKPDIGLMTASEMATRASYICDAVQIPVIADADTGYGNYLNVMRTVKDFERAGISAIQLEDQDFPKRCGHLRDKNVIPLSEMIGKIKAAVDTRVDENLLIIARTDSRAINGLQEAIERAQCYAEAGADIIFVEALENKDEFSTITNYIQMPLLANMVEGGKSPLMSASELDSMGYKIVIFPNSVTRVVAKAAQDLFHELKETGTTAGMKEQMLNFSQLNQLLGIQRYHEMEEKYVLR